MGKADFTG